MSLSLQVEWSDDASAALAAIGDTLEHREGLNEKIAQDELALVQEHLNRIANDRHATADSLGAAHSNFWANPGGYTESSSDATQATVDIHHAGIGRATRDVTITPGPGKKYLTLPLLAEAYNQRAAGLDHLFVIRSHEGALFLARHDDPGSETGLTVLYLLVTSVTLPQDSTLLPEEQDFLDKATISIDEYLDAAFAARRAA